MTCSESEMLIKRYINNDLDIYEVTDLLKHLQQCKDCREELEIHYILEYGLSEREEPKSFDFKRQIEEKLEYSRSRVISYKKYKRIRFITIALTNILCILAALYVLVI